MFFLSTDIFHFNFIKKEGPDQVYKHKVWYEGPRTERNPPQIKPPEDRPHSSKLSTPQLLWPDPATQAPSKRVGKENLLPIVG